MPYSPAKATSEPGRGPLTRRLSRAVLPRLLVTLLVTCASSISWAAGETTLPSTSSQRTRIACDLACYGPNPSAAWRQLSEIGITHVVMAVSETGAIPRIRDLLDQHKLKVLGLRADVDFSAPTAADQLAQSIDQCQSLGAKFLLLTAHYSEDTKDATVAALRESAAQAAENDVAIAVSNRSAPGPTVGDLLRLLRLVDRPNVRGDVDTGAIHENEEEGPAEEALSSIVHDLATVTLSDHDNRPRSGVYPPIGHGVVDISGVLGLLKKEGFTGPLIVRFDPAGILNSDQSATEQEELVKKAVAQSLGLVMMLDMSVGRMTGADYFMLVGYFLLMLGIGAYFFRQMRGIKDYFSGGNNIPWWLSGVSFYMSSFSVFAFVSYSALAYHYGWLPVTLLWVTVPATVFSVLLFARRWRRARIDSPVEYLEYRYSSGLRQLFAWQGIPVKMVDDALKLVAIGAFISVSLGLGMTQSMFWSGIIILLYTFMGGLWAVTVTDFVQFVVMAVAILVLIPLSAQRLGGIDQVGQIMPHSLSDFFTSEYNMVYLALLTLLYCVAWSSVNWPLIQRYYCVANEREAIKVGWCVTFLNAVGPPLILFPAIAAGHFLGAVPDDKYVYPLLCVELLPPGVLGLVIAAMFAATMSMLSSDYNVCAGVLTNDVYRRLLRPDASQRQLVAVGRVMTLVVGGFALAAAMWMSAMSGEGLFKTMVTLFGVVTAPVGVPMILGLLSRRVTNMAALWGWFLGLLAGFALLAWCPDNITLGADTPEGDWLFPLILEKEVLIFGGALVVSLATTLAVSAFARMSADQQQRVDAFHRRLATPIGEFDEDEVAGSSGFSPFKVVGVSILCIGLMLLSVLPWVGGWGLACGMVAGFGLALLLIGALMTWVSRESKPARAGV